jgi:hypothetical protein
MSGACFALELGEAFLLLQRAFALRNPESQSMRLAGINRSSRESFRCPARLSAQWRMQWLDRIKMSSERETYRPRRIAPSLEDGPQDSDDWRRSELESEAAEGVDLYWFSPRTRR